MQQKICSHCSKPLSQHERSLDMIQCTPCYQKWIANVAIPAQGPIHELITSLRESDRRESS